MVRVQLLQWNQTLSDLQRLALEASHKRTRERFLALYRIANGSNATQVALQLRRSDETVLSWVHSYNQHGPDSLTYRKTGGRPPFAHNFTPPSHRK